MSAVRVIDTETRTRFKVRAKLVFLCASAIGSTQILLNSPGADGVRPFAHGGGSLGRYLMDHTFQAGARGVIPGFTEYYPYGFRPNGIYVPRFRNLDAGGEVDFLRGYGYQGGARRLSWSQMAKATPGFGADFKHRLREPGPWMFSLSGFGEILPYEHNDVRLHPTKKDRFGMPQVTFRFAFGDNEKRQREDLIATRTLASNSEELRFQVRIF